MRVLLDTNIILDQILRREPNYTLVKEIFEMIFCKSITGFTTANGLTDIYYIASKKLGKDTTKNALLILIRLLKVISVDSDDCTEGLKLPITDFEDALIVVCANKTKIDYIITNDKDFPIYGCNKSVVIKPEDFLQKVL